MGHNDDLRLFHVRRPAFLAHAVAIVTARQRSTAHAFTLILIEINVTLNISLVTTGQLPCHYLVTFDLGEVDSLMAF